MDYVRTFRSFINSYYLNESLRMTAGMLLPAFVMLYLDLLPIGITISLGALFVSITDNPGPIQHRTNGMLICILVIFFVTLLSGIANTSPLFLGLFLLVACFAFSMIAIFGKRAGDIGVAALVMLVLDLGQERHGWENLKYAGLITTGAIWYSMLSLVLYNFRPFKLIQQALGDWMQSIADFLLLRAEFYKKQVDYRGTSLKLLQQQALVQEKQNVVNELIFETQNVVKETTNTGRILMMMYLDTSELFEKIMSSYQSYSTLHHYFDETDILDQYRSILVKIAIELEEIAIAVKSSSPATPNETLFKDILRVKENYEDLRASYLKPDNINGFISIKQILDNIEDIAERLQTLYTYTKYGKIKKGKKHQVNYKDFITHEPVKPQLFIDNLSLKSEIFRHSIRLSIAVLIGYIISLIFDFGYSYWILLTIVIIMKPAYSLSKKLNGDRLFGTISGVLIGFIILLITTDTITLLILMILFMIGYFSTMRTNYFVSVMLMTPYVILFFHLLYPAEFPDILTDRIVDTTVGSAIAIISMILVLPIWEREKINSLMVESMEKNIKYFKAVAKGFRNKTIDVELVPIERKNALVALANLSDALKRMRSEPKFKQKGMDDIHKFVVLNHMFTSYVATLSGYLKNESNIYFSPELEDVIEEISSYLSNSSKRLIDDIPECFVDAEKQSLQQLNQYGLTLVEKRSSELAEGHFTSPTTNLLLNVKSVIDQFNLIHKVARDMNKMAGSIRMPVN